MVRGFRVCSLALTTLLGCASSPGTVRHEHHVDGIVVLEADHYRVRGYDPNDPRLVRVEEQLAEVLGRRLVLRFNVALMPRAEVFFEHFFDDELGKLPQAFRSWKSAKPQDFAAMTADLRHVDFDYDGSLPEPKAEVGAPPERLRFVLNSWTLPEELLNGALARLRRSSVARRYLDVAPGEVPAADRSAYLEALTQFGADYFYARDGKAPENREPRGGRSEVMLRTLALRAAAGEADPKLSQALFERLLTDGAYLREVYQGRPEFLRDLREPSRFLRAERAWIAWALGALDSLPPEPRYRLFDLLIVPQRSSPRALLEPRAFPGFSLSQRGLSLFGAWARAGYPTAAGQGQPAADPKTRLFDRVLCPTAANSRGFRTLRARNCSEAFYATSLSDPASREALLGLAATSPDTNVSREIALNLLALTSSHVDSPKPPAITAVLDLWRKLEASPARFREMARLLAVEIDHSYDLREALYDQATRYYRDRTADRGALLFLLARVDGYGRTPINWKNFAATYGAPLDTPELSSYFDQSYLAFDEFKNLLDALGSVPSPGTIVASKIRRYLDDPLAASDTRTREMVLRAIISTLDRLGDAPGLAALRTELHAYVGNDPTRERVFREVLSLVDTSAAKNGKSRSSP